LSPSLFNKFKSFPVVVFSAIGIALFLYFFAFLFPFTNNAFVVADIMPVAADVSGFITDIYVKNGQEVKKGQPLFKVYQDPYIQMHNQSVANYEEAKANIEVIKQETKKNQALLEEAQQSYQRINYEYTLKINPRVNYAISKLDIEQLGYARGSLANKVKSLQAQLKVDDAQIIQQQKKVQALAAAMKNAKINLDLTIVNAYADGIVDNMYLSNGTPVIQHQPLFSFVNTDSMYIQANFNEIDLRNVHAGSEVLIFPRVYSFKKIYHGVVVGNTWAANRQITTAKSQIQTVTQSENNWIMLPQRLPVQIKITDYDYKNFPLSVGSSAYVYIKTK
jgi:multidrug resistance efflux pump